MLAGPGGKALAPRELGLLPKNLCFSPAQSRQEHVSDDGCVGTVMGLATPGRRPSSGLTCYLCLSSGNPGDQLGAIFPTPVILGPQRRGGSEEKPQKKGGTPLALTSNSELSSDPLP